MAFRWTERRVALLVTIIASSTVVVADVVLFFIFRQHADNFQPPWDRAIPVGIAGILLFALWRLRRMIRLFRQDR